MNRKYTQIKKFFAKCEAGSWVLLGHLLEFSNGWKCFPGQFLMVDSQLLRQMWPIVL